MTRPNHPILLILRMMIDVRVKHMTDLYEAWYKPEKADEWLAKYPAGATCILS
jgi:hypothetical protein